MTMPARDANNATWYLLRYREDFTPRIPSPIDPSPPQLESSLLYDDRRGVLELRPDRPDRDLAPLPGVAIGADGEIYRVDPRTGQLVERRCDGSERVIVCEPGVLASPAGLAIDRRGLLYVADPRARRVVVVRPENGSVAAIIADKEMREPLDVAIGPTGRVFVADREAGMVRVFDARFSPAGRFVPRDASGLPAEPRPVAVLVDADDAIVVADARFPRLLRFAADGTPVASASVASLASAITSWTAPLTALRVVRFRAARFRAGVCEVGTCAPADSGPRYLIELHRALRLLALELHAAYAQRGVFISAALDSGEPGTTWHKVELDADVPAGTAVTIETHTSDTRGGFPPLSDDAWEAPRGPNGASIPFDEHVTEQLVQSDPGRFVWLRVTLRSSGLATPSVRSIRIRYPRVSYSQSLPRVFRRDPGAARFLEHYLALFERVLTGVEDDYDGFSRELNPDAASGDVLEWLACLVNLVFDPSWSVERRRALVAAAMDLYRTRGTVVGIARYIEIYTGVRPEIIEAFTERPRAEPIVGVAGGILACSLHLTPPAAETTPKQTLWRRYAHRFTVFVPLDDPCDEEVILPVVERIVATSKPAHTLHVLRPIYPDARVGVQSTVGIDYVVGARSQPAMQIGDPKFARVLGHDAVLGPRGPSYVRPQEREL